MIKYLLVQSLFLDLGNYTHKVYQRPKLQVAIAPKGKDWQKTKSQDYQVAF